MAINFDAIKKSIFKKSVLGIALASIIAGSVFLLPFNHVWKPEICQINAN